MNPDELTTVWRSQDLSPLYGVDRNLLHQMLRQEQAKLEKQRRNATRFMYVTTAFLLIIVALFFAILIDPNQPATFSSRLTLWDYAVGVVGIGAALILVGALVTARRSQLVREQGYGDSLRDHLRRRIAQLDAGAAGERRLAMTILVTTVICAAAIAILSGRISHVPVPWSEMFGWPSPFKIVLILGFLYLLFFRWTRPDLRRHLARKRELEALLKQLDE